MKFKSVLAGLTLSALSMSASAHDIYIWPSFFTVNSDKTAHIPVDITASHTTYRPDFAMPSSGVVVNGVDGKRVRNVGAFYEGARRSSFDLVVDQEGTYALKYDRDPAYFTRYKIGRSEEFKHKRMTKSVAAESLPKKAREVETSAYATVAMSYVTNKAPTEAALKPQNKGFEVVPVTHPSDYVTGEEIAIKLLFNGEPVAEQEIKIELEGPQYRETPVVHEAKSDKDGLVNVEFAEGGRYIFKTYHKQKSQDPEADWYITRVYYAFEVIYE